MGVFNNIKPLLIQKKSLWKKLRFVGRLVVIVVRKQSGQYCCLALSFSRLNTEWFQVSLENKCYRKILKNCNTQGKTLEFKSEALQWLDVSGVQVRVLQHSYSVFPFLRRVVTKFSSEVGCGEVINPKQPVRERDRQSPTGLQCHYMCVYVEMGVVSFIATQQYAERSELFKFLARMSNSHRDRQVVYCLIGQRRFHLSPLGQHEDHPT